LKSQRSLSRSLVEEFFKPIKSSRAAALWQNRFEAAIITRRVSGSDLFMSGICHGKELRKVFFVCFALPEKLTTPSLENIAIDNVIKTNAIWIFHSFCGAYKLFRELPPNSLNL
jgi:hypothetical protein